ncbi:MAG: flagellum-specific ATP synthase FliI, partial [Treponema sp.]|nr:flagellum-specific ATP synthase FliI [Treponema sp.]
TITAFYTVLVDGDDMNEPISDKVRGTLDGHIILDRKLAMAFHYPAIDVLSSISRLSKRVTGVQTQKAVGKVRTLMALYDDNEMMITTGIYQKGNSPEIDEAIEKHGAIKEFLMQEEYEKSTIKETLDKLSSLTGIQIPAEEYFESPPTSVRESSLDILD